MRLIRFLFREFIHPNVQNAAKIAIFAAFVAQFAYFPPNRQADVSEVAAESTFLSGGKLG